VTRIQQTLFRVLRGTSDANLRFNDLRKLLEGLGFIERIKGSHHIFAQDGIADIVNLQPDGSKAKPYQVKQVRQLINKYKLAGRLYEED
jgi:predicted RNA binding protein YcfA (HicA-like mRNA interferase family)